MPEPAKDAPAVNDAGILRESPAAALANGNDFAKFRNRMLKAYAGRTTQPSPPKEKPHAIVQRKGITVVSEAADLLEAESNWTRCAYAAGLTTLSESPDAVHWCAIGATKRAIATHGWSNEDYEL